MRVCARRVRGDRWGSAEAVALLLPIDQERAAPHRALSGVCGSWQDRDVEIVLRTETPEGVEVVLFAIV
jgi:hypothetical protein